MKNGKKEVCPQKKRTALLWGIVLLLICLRPAGAEPLGPAGKMSGQNLQAGAGLLQPISMARPAPGYTLTSESTFDGDYRKAALKMVRSLASELAPQGPCSFTQAGRPFNWKNRAVVTMQQVCGGRPVAGARSRVIFDRNQTSGKGSSPGMVGMMAHFIALSEPDAGFTKEKALDVVLQHLGVLNQAELRRVQIEELISEQPGLGSFVPAYQVTVERLDPYGYYDYFVSRSDGAILGRRNRVFHAVQQFQAFPPLQGAPWAKTQRIASDEEGVSPFHALAQRRPAVQAQGLVFLQNPIEDRQQTSVEPLRYLLGDGHLQSRYFRVQPAQGDALESRDQQFMVPWRGFRDTDSHFAEVQAYYGSGKIFDYFVLQGFEPPEMTPGSRQLPVLVHFGHKWANAMYNGELIALGDGDGVEFYPLSLDNDVLAHEYSHYVVDKLRPFETRDDVGFGAALHEGYADYFAIAARGALADLEQDSQLAEGIRIRGGALRDLNNEEHYGHYLEYANGVETIANGERDYDPHKLGQVWGSALWKLRQALIVRLGEEEGRRVADQLAYGSLIYFEATGLYGTPGFVDAARALLRADRELFRRKYQPLIAEVLERRGFPALSR